MLVLLTYVYAFQESYNNPEDGLCFCDILALVKFDDGETTTSNGTMQMQIHRNSTDADPVPFQTLSPVVFSSTGHHPDLGEVTWTLRSVAEVPDSRIQANQENELFPATCDIYFYVDAHFSGLPGITFSSATPVHMRSENLMSFNRHVNEVYHVVEPVSFLAEDGSVAFTVTELTSTLN
jgi:hypothetical protein